MVESLRFHIGLDHSMGIASWVFPLEAVVLVPHQRVHPH